MVKVSALNWRNSPPMDRAKSDAAYFTRRASEERAAARRAHDPRSRQTHLDLAERYALAAQSCARHADDAEPMPEAPAMAPLLQPEFRILP
jgi:hypothetical protein